jgi:hypothetical protein
MLLLRLKNSKSGLKLSFYSFVGTSLGVQLNCQLNNDVAFSVAADE